MGIWRILLTRLKKHSIYHLIIPLAGGILVEFLVKLVFGENNKLASLTGLFWFHLLSLILGVCISWLIVMFILINQETKKRVEEDSLAILEDTLDEATSYYAVSVIPLTEWFDPALQIYATKLLSRKLETNNFRHERILLFFSDREYEKSRIELMDEFHYGRCLAHMHRDCGIPLSFMKRKDIFAVLDQLEDKYKEKLGCDPRWTNGGSANGSQKLSLRRLSSRIGVLDFALVTKPDDTNSVLRISKHGEKISIKEELEGDDAEPYAELVRLIKRTVYKSNKLRGRYNFIRGYGFTERIQPQPRSDANATQLYFDYRKVLVKRLAEKGKAQFRIKKCTRVVRIHEGSGDATVRMDFEGVSGYPNGQKREKLPMSFTSKSGFSRDPRIINGEHVRWEWDASSESRDVRGGFVVFGSALEEEDVSFSMETETYNAFHFNQRDRLDVAGSIEESASITPENLYDSYVLRVEFPLRHFPKEFKIHVTNEFKRPNYKEEKLVRPGFERFDSESTVVLNIEKPLAGYTYKIVWTLPENDVDELGFTGHSARIMRETIRRLVTLDSDADRAQSVRVHLNELQRQVARAKFGPDAVDDPALEVTLHAYSEEKHGLVIVASNDTEDADVIPVGRSTVGQAYRRRALVRWVLDPDSDDSDFWDYGAGHRGIVSIPLFYPIDAGVRTCIVSIATKSSESGFLKIIKNLDHWELLQTFTHHVNAWYAQSLAGALGLPDLTKKLPTQSHTSEEI